MGMGCDDTKSDNSSSLLPLLLLAGGGSSHAVRIDRCTASGSDTTHFTLYVGSTERWHGGIIRMSGQPDVLVPNLDYDGTTSAAYKGGDSWGSYTGLPAGTVQIYTGTTLEYEFTLGDAGAVDCI